MDTPEEVVAIMPSEPKVSSPANIRAYAISLRENLPVGQVRVAIDSDESGVSSHPSVVADMTDGFALTGGGADVHWRGAGNLLWRLEPTTTTSNQEFAASFKDHDISDPSSIAAYALGIQITYETPTRVPRC
jgi:hypothetical protein